MDHRTKVVLRVFFSLKSKSTQRTLGKLVNTLGLPNHKSVGLTHAICLGFSTCQSNTCTRNNVVWFTQPYMRSEQYTEKGFADLLAVVPCSMHPSLHALWKGGVGVYRYHARHDNMYSSFEVTEQYKNCTFIHCLLLYII